MARRDCPRVFSLEILQYAVHRRGARHPEFVKQLKTVPLQYPRLTRRRRHHHRRHRRRRLLRRRLPRRALRLV